MSEAKPQGKGNWIATITIVVISALAIAGVWATAPIRQAELHPAAEEYLSPEAVDVVVASHFSTAWTAPSVDPSLKPIVSEGLVIASQSLEDHSEIFAIDAYTGERVWSYTAAYPLCSLGKAWGKTVATFRGPAGCGEVIAFDTRTGTYDRNRAAIAPEEVVPVSSNDRVGIVAPSRFELWRSDLVRTVEYGHDEAPQEEGFQPHADCEISSVLTRKENVAVLNVCEDGEHLRFLSATPEDSRKPEIDTSFEIPGTGAQVVAISEKAAAVYVDEPTPRILTYSKDSKEPVSIDVAPSPLVRQATGAFAAAVADLPHNMTWFDGERLYLFGPGELTVQHIIEGVIGTGAMIGEELFLPTPGGYITVRPATGEILRRGTVDRGGYSGPVSMLLADGTVVEKRGDTLAALSEQER